MSTKRIFTLIIIVALLFCNNNYAAISISTPIKNVTAKENIIDINLTKILKLSIKDFEKTTGLHLSFKQKVALRILKLQSKLQGGKKTFSNIDEPKFKKRALWAKWLGIGSLIGLVVPIIGILSVPAAILAIIFGATTIKKLTNKSNSKQGIYFGIATLATILLLVLIVIVIISSFTLRTP
jgi:hypothetical protein